MLLVTVGAGDRPRLRSVGALRAASLNRLKIVEDDGWSGERVTRDRRPIRPSARSPRNRAVSTARNDESSYRCRIESPISIGARNRHNVTARVLRCDIPEPPRRRSVQAAFRGAPPDVRRSLTDSLDRAFGSLGVAPVGGCDPVAVPVRRGVKVRGQRVSTGLDDGRRDALLADRLLVEAVRVEVDGGVQFGRFGVVELDAAVVWGLALTTPVPATLATRAAAVDVAITRRRVKSTMRVDRRMAR